MMDKTMTGETLHITRAFDAPVERVWRAFTDAAALERWYALNDEWGPTTAEVDLRVGGAYRFTLRPPGGAFIESGEFREITPNQRLVYTCSLLGEGEVGHDETLVTIEFRDLGDGRTEISLTQEGFANSRERDVHGGGWNMFLDRVVRVLEG